MLLHKNQNNHTKTIEFQQYPPRSQISHLLVHKLNLGTRDGMPNVINDLQHQSRLRKTAKTAKYALKKVPKIVNNRTRNVQNRKKSHQKRLKSTTSRAFFLSINSRVRRQAQRDPALDESTQMVMQLKEGVFVWTYVRRKFNSKKDCKLGGFVPHWVAAFPEG